MNAPLTDIHGAIACGPLEQSELDIEQQISGATKAESKLQQFGREDVEAVIACLGDDAAQLRQENDEDERADNMDGAASMLTWMLLSHPLYAAPAVAPSAQPVPEKYDDVLLPFLSLMRKELHANTGKGDRPGWLAMSPEMALLEVYHHLAKLQKAVRNNDGPGIQEYSADVANMAMMVLDVCGGLAFIEPAASPAVAPSAQPVTREFANELGNRIRITIEGPTSISENILTPVEFAELRAAIGAAPSAQQPQAAGLSERAQFEACGLRAVTIDEANTALATARTMHEKLAACESLAAAAQAEVQRLRAAIGAAPSAQQPQAAGVSERLTDAFVRDVAGKAPRQTGSNPPRMRCQSCRCAWNVGQAEFHHDDCFWVRARSLLSTTSAPAQAEQPAQDGQQK